MTATSNQDGAPGLESRVESVLRKGDDGIGILALMGAGAHARCYWNRALLFYMGLLILAATAEGEFPPPPNLYSRRRVKNAAGFTPAHSAAHSFLHLIGP